MTAERNDGGSAFPLAPQDTHPEWGMTLRDWFAGQALAGLTANPEEAKGTRNLSLAKTTETAAKAAYLLADAMLVERAK